MKVRMFERRSGEKDFKDSGMALLDFGRLPTVGEYIATEGTYDAWLYVELVVHTPKDDHIAQLYCTIFEAVEVIQRLVDD